MNMKDVKKIVVPNPDKVILPSGYTQKTYISKIGNIISSGYIDLGITPTANTNIECTFEYTARTLDAGSYQQGAIFGAFRGESLRDSTNSFFLSIYKSWNSTDAKSLALGYGNKWKYAYDQFTSDTIYTFRNDGGNVYINNVLNADLSTNDALFNKTMGKLMIGAFGGRNDWGSAITAIGGTSFKLYRFKVWENGVLIKDLIPAVQESTSYISLYDLVNNEFITPTINFDNYGNNVEATKEVKKIEDSNGNIIWGSASAFPYRRLEYIYFSGVDEYIQEDFNLATKQRKMILEYTLDSFVDNATLMGQWDGTATNNQARLYVVRFNTNANRIRSAVGGTFTTAITPSLDTKYKSTVEYTSASAPTLTVKVEQGSTTLLNTTVTQSGQTSVSSFGAIGKVGCSTEKPTGSTTTGPAHYWVGKLYKYEKYRTDTNVNQNMQYPAQRKSDGVCGLFDTNGSRFFPMTGTNITSAAAGPVVDEYWDLTDPS